MCVTIPLINYELDDNFKDTVLKSIGLTFEEYFTKIIHVAMNSIAEKAGVRRGCRVVSVLPWGSGSTCSKVTKTTRDRNGDILPGVLQISSVDDLISALRRCVEAKVRKIGLELRVYPFSSINTRRVALSASKGEAITGMRFQKGVLQQVDTSPLVSLVDFVFYLLSLIFILFNSCV